MHTTPGNAFQEEGYGSAMRSEEVSIPKSNRRSIKLTKETDNAHATIQPKKEPPSFAGMGINEEEHGADKLCSNVLVMWKSVRFLSSGDQIHPRFSLWIITQLQN